MGHELDVGAVAAKRRTYRPRMDERAWRELFARFDVSGLSIEEFCSRHGIGRSSFGRWRARLRGTSAVSSSPAACAPSSRASVQAAAGLVAPLIEVGSLVQALTRKAPQRPQPAGGGASQPTHAAPAALELRLELGAGLVLTLVRR
jgi:hypothetical protein